MSDKKRNIIVLSVGLSLIVILLIAIFLIPETPKSESINGIMQDAVLHETNKIAFFGLEVNPAVISAFSVTGIFLIFSLIVRIFVIPRFKLIPGKFQLLLEEAVGMFDRLAKTNSPHRNGFLGAYIFTAGAYISIGTIFELLGIQVITTAGHAVVLPAPLADINGAITMGCVSYAVILGGGIVANGLRGAGRTLKDFSLPISMSFRLFGALLSGALVTELVYYYMATSIVIPVVVGVLFTLLHALVQTYVLTMLTALFYGEAVEKTEKSEKPKKAKKIRKQKRGI